MACDMHASICHGMWYAMLLHAMVSEYAMACDMHAPICYGMRHACFYRPWYQSMPWHTTCMPLYTMACGTPYIYTPWHVTCMPLYARACDMHASTRYGIRVYHGM
eukprot:1160585-Pelagomonas_calceolata.AAC.9